MRINVKQPVLDYEGKPLTATKKDKNGDLAIDDTTKRPIMEPEVLRTYLSTALNSTVPGETLTAEDKAKIYMLTTKLYKSNEVDLTDDDRVFLRERVGVIYGPLIYGRVCEILRKKSAQEMLEDQEEPAETTAPESEPAK